MALSIPTKLNGGKKINDCQNTSFNTKSIIYKCEKCGNIEKNLMEKKIISKPKNLIFAIKRYDNNRQKIKKMLNYPKFIDINNENFYFDRNKDSSRFFFHEYNLRCNRRESISLARNYNCVFDQH